jgi:hypothetical protein
MDSSATIVWEGQFSAFPLCERCPQSIRFRLCPTASKLRIAERAGQSVERVFGIIPCVREIPRVRKSLVDRVPQLAGSKFVKFTNHHALKSVSVPIGQAGCDDGLDDLRPSVHPRRQMSRVCWASSRGPFRFDQMSVHPPVPAFADITHNIIHDDRINVAADRCFLPGGPPR